LAQAALRVVDDCGECKFCLDKPKFGGANTMKQRCVRRSNIAMTFFAREDEVRLSLDPTRKHMSYA